MNKNVIVTGATGFIGSYLVKELLQNQYEVYAIVRNAEKMTKMVSGQGLHLIETDLEHFSEDDLPNCQFDTFYHLGWSGVNREEINEPAVHRKNRELSMKCLKIAKSIGCRCFMDAGSKAEYGMQCEEQSENAACCPDTAYGKEKLRFYQEALAFCQEKGIRYFHARLFSVIGVGDHPWSLVSTACSAFSRNEELQLGPCTQLWNFTAVEDVVCGLRLLSEYEAVLPTDDNLVYNIAGKDTRVLREFVNEIHSICGSESEIRYGKMQNAGGCMNPVSDKIRRLTGWEETLSFRDSIRCILHQTDACKKA